MLGRKKSKSRVVEIAPGQTVPSTITSEEQTAKPQTSAPASRPSASAFHSIFFCFSGEPKSSDSDSEEHAALMPKK